MSTTFENIRVESQKKLDELRNELRLAYPEGNLNNQICIYACGSMGRLEMTEKSDLDLFFVTEDNGFQDFTIPNLDKYLFFSKLYEINSRLKYQDPSKDGMYWEFTPKKNLLDIGSRQEDYNNSFTARMLLLLESKPLYNEKAYKKIVKETIDKYFSDYTDYSDEFYPLFLMNDILRYWYTLTLNYEYRRDDKDDVNKRYWKRLKLKYARLITCYSMLACLYQKNISPEYVLKSVEMTPFERLSMLADEREEIKDIVLKIETAYEWYLELRKKGPGWWGEPQNKVEAMTKADNFHNLVVHNFMKRIADGNPALRNRADVY